MVAEGLKILYFDRFCGIKRVGHNTKALQNAANGEGLHITGVTRIKPVGEDPGLERVVGEEGLGLNGIVFDGLLLHAEAYRFNEAMEHVALSAGRGYIDKRQVVVAHGDYQPEIALLGDTMPHLVQYNRNHPAFDAKSAADVFAVLKQVQQYARRA